jgi:thiol-disulfide isomerase/thioredoxin
MMHTLFLFLSLLNAPTDDSLRVVQILSEAQATIRSTRTLTYQSEWRQIYSGVDDSVAVVTGTTWLERLPGDTIFGYRFHIKGNYRGAFDYFYDGRLSREYQHKDKEITEFNPYEDNSEHSPAKARMSLLPILPLETDTALVANFLNHCASLTLADSGGFWAITKVYQTHDAGQATTQYLWIDKNSHRILRSESISLFNGTRFHLTVSVGGIVGDMNVRDSLAEPVGLAYTTTRYVKPAPRKPSPLEGKMAPDFSYTAFDGQHVRLSDLRGQYVLLDFWESWCGWCIDAFPHLASLDSGYRGQKFRLISIVSENLDKVQTILDANNVPYSTLRGDSTVIQHYRVDGRPTYVLIDPKGKILAYGPGDLDRMKALLREHLGEPATATR